MGFVIKGTSVGWDIERFRSDKESLGLYIVSVLTTWQMKIESENRPLTRDEGKIKKAFYGMKNDIHNLAVIIDMMETISQDNNSRMQGKDSLYITVLLESYFTNLRSIFDFTTLIIRLTVEQENLKRLPTKNEESFNKLLGFIKNVNNKGIYPQEICNIILNHEVTFNIIKDIRDLIIHKGDEPIIYSQNGSYEFSFRRLKVGDDQNIALNILNSDTSMYPLFDYLSKITNRMFSYLEDLTPPIYNYICKKEGKEVNLWLAALEGVCIFEFVDFLGWNKIAERDSN